mmetsp:Transcript_16898/g.22112  ORF Transcript_16898/g.22112 Transcript_16898/m.22112 type:complete len:218 (+) Transcript_16898:285-938(+)
MDNVTSPIIERQALNEKSPVVLKLTPETIDASKKIFSMDSTKRKAEEVAHANESIKKLCRQLSVGLDYEIEPDMNLTQQLFRRHSTIQFLKGLDTESSDATAVPSLVRDSSSISMMSMNRTDSFKDFQKASSFIDFGELEKSLQEFDAAVTDVDIQAITQQDEDIIEKVIEENKDMFQKSAGTKTPSPVPSRLTAPQKLERKLSWQESLSETSWRVF